MKALVPAEPEVIACALREDDEYLVIACDGLWDVLSAEDVGMLIRAQIQSGADLQTVARTLTTEALNLGSFDNVTALVVALRPSGAPAGHTHT